MQRDRRTLEAMHRLSAAPDYQIFLGWLESYLAEVMDLLVRASSEAELRQHQGEARVIKEILDRAADTGDVLGKLAAQGRRGKP